MPVELYGKGLLGPIKPSVKGLLAKRFVVRPFTVLLAYEGFWARRKRAWLSLGIRGTDGRFTEETIENGKPAFAIGNSRVINDRWRMAKRGGVDGRLRAKQQQHKKKKFRRNVRPDQNVNMYHDQIRSKKKKTRHNIRVEDPDLMRKRKKAYNDHEWQLNVLGKIQAPTAGAGTSSFDPVLCELVYRWFCVPGGRTLDPFCGGATSGIVATALGYRFTGIDTRPEQIKANYPQADFLEQKPEWINGDSEKLDTLIPAKRKFDLIWTDPPYYDLEIYGGGSTDGSTHKSFHQFMNWYRRIFSKCVERLKNNRFCVLKIGEIRGKDGSYYNFVGQTIDMFQALGLHYYNEMILVTAAGSLPIRAGKQFNGSRKLGRTHQTVLVFWKGDPRDVKKHFGEIEA